MKRDAGFTLLEILVALVVLGLVVAGLGQGLRFGLDATARQERQAVERGDLDAVDRLLRRLVAQMDPGTQRDPALLAGNAGSVTFTTDLGAAASALSTSRAEIGLGIAAGRLVLHWQPAIHAVRLDPAPPPGEVVVLEGVERLQIAYFGSVGGAAPAWNAAWEEKSLPTLLRIRLVFPQGSGRRWPDIVAGPVTPRARP